MAETIVELLTDVADAIREKKGTTDKINAQNFAEEIKNLPSGSAPRWTGHADAEGLRAIGWDDEDIAYYQKHGVNWNEEDDEYHKVSDDNKALYGVLNINNIQTYKDRIVYLPKIDIGTKSTLIGTFSSCFSLVAIPLLDTRNVTNMRNIFYDCYSLVTIPLLDTQNVTNTSGMFNNCYSLLDIPPLDTQNVENMKSMFQGCRSLVTIPLLDTQNVTDMSNMFHSCSSLVAIPKLDTHNVTNMSNMFHSCYPLAVIPPLDTQNATNMGNMCYESRSLKVVPQLDMKNVNQPLAHIFYMAYSLTEVYCKNTSLSLLLNQSPLLSKESLLYIINNEAATEPITITLAAYAYTRLAEDADVVAALANHPNVSLAK